MPSNKRRISKIIYHIREKIANTRQNTPEYRRLRHIYNLYYEKIHDDGYNNGYNNAFERYIVHYSPYIWTFIVIGIITGSYCGFVLLNTISTVKINTPNSIFIAGTTGGILGATFVYWSINIWCRFQRKRGK